MLIDSHAHLDDVKFIDDLEEVVRQFDNNDIELILDPASNEQSSRKIVEMVNKYKKIYGAVGTHPHDASEMTEATLDLYKEFSKDAKIIAIGEIGLDYHYDFSPREVQKKWFREQIRLAKDLDLPYIVHDREAHEDIFNIMKEEQSSYSRGILHCYSGNVDLAREFIKMGFLISLGGPVTFKNSKVPKKVATEIPLEHLLIETDSPYLAPTPNRGMRNEPAFVKFVAEEIARLKEVDYSVVVNKTNENFKKLFKLA